MRANLVSGRRAQTKFTRHTPAAVGRRDAEPGVHPLDQVAGAGMA